MFDFKVKSCNSCWANSSIHLVERYGQFYLSINNSLISLNSYRLLSFTILHLQDIIPHAFSAQLDADPNGEECGELRDLVKDLQEKEKSILALNDTRGAPVTCSQIRSKCDDQCYHFWNRMKSLARLNYLLRGFVTDFISFSACDECEQHRGCEKTSTCDLISKQCLLGGPGHQHPPQHLASRS